MGPGPVTSRRPVDSETFRTLCGHFTTGVAVVTAADGSTPVGMTVNSFTSVSLVPPLVSINVDRAAQLHRQIVAAPAFVINILAADQEALSRRFAEDHPDRFDSVPWSWTDSGLPALDGTLARIECEHHAVFEAGDHSIVVGLVVDGAATDRHPLRYYRGSYHNGTA